MQIKIWTTTLFLVFGMMFSIAQTAEEVNEILPGTWKMTYITGPDGEKMEYPSEVVFKMIFLKNGIAEVIIGEDRKQLTWSYSEGKRTLFIGEKEKGDDGFKLKIIDENMIEFGAPGASGANFVLKREGVYRKKGGFVK